MGLTGPTRPNFNATRPASSPAPGNPQVDGLGDALLEQGLASSRTSSREVASAVVTKLKSEGLLGSNLKSTIAKVQAQAGLAQTGKLDGPTSRYLEKQGFFSDAGGSTTKAAEGEAKASTDKGVPQKNAADKSPASKNPVEQAGGVVKESASKPQGPTVKVGKNRTPKGQGPQQPPSIPKSRDTAKLTGKGSQTIAPMPGEKTASHDVQLAAQAGVRGGIGGSDHSAPQTQKGLGDLLQSLMSLGFLGGKRGDSTSDAIRTFQQSVGLPPTGKLDPDTQLALKQQKAAADTATSMQKPEGGGSGAGPGKEAKVDAKASSSSKDVAEAQSANTAHQSTKHTSASATEKSRTESTNASQAATMRGVATALADPASAAGRASDGQGAAVKKGKGGDGAGQLEGAAGALDEGDEDGTEGLDTNSHAGDEDVEDEGRGHANIGGEGEHEEGYYEVSGLSAQIGEALELIARDDDGGGPATYRWDVTFYRPGVFGAFQPAEPLWHIGIEKVGPFDPVWIEAARVLTDRLAQVEPDAAPITAEDFQAALRRARVRATSEPDASAEP